MRLTASLITLLVTLGAAVHGSENWTRFRGPNGTGVSDATNLPTTFGPDINVRWKTSLPPGHSSPVVTDTRIFLTAHTLEKTEYQLFVIALDRANGRELWRREVPRRQVGRGRT